MLAKCLMLNAGIWIIATMVLVIKLWFDEWNHMLFVHSIFPVKWISQLAVVDWMKMLYEIILHDFIFEVYLTRKYTKK